MTIADEQGMEQKGFMFKMEKRLKKEKKKKARVYMCLANYIYESLLWERRTIMGDNNSTWWGS